MRASLSDKIFLSHLCGGEDKLKTTAVVRCFLSHLCGGEVGLPFWSSVDTFLSHLCGGEDAPE